jgi:acyl-CoA thioester hydrolase
MTSNSFRDGWFAYEFPVRFTDNDQMGHINNVSYVRYLEEGRIAYWRSLVVSGLANAPQWILAEQHIAYKAQGSFPDSVRVRTRLAAFLPKGWVWEQEIDSVRSGELLATGWCRNLTFDYGGGRASGLPGDLRDAMIAFEDHRDVPRVERWMG